MVYHNFFAINLKSGSLIMLKKIIDYSIIAFSICTAPLIADLQYDIQDIGTLQTHSSEAIALNNKGQILGWYNIDGTNAGKHFFIRDRDGQFFEVPLKEIATGWEINWRYLTNDGKAYGTFDGNGTYPVLYQWDQKKGAIKLGNLPGKEISAINDAGQVLINSVIETESGRNIRRPAIWHNGNTITLKGSYGDLGIESEESYGLDMNNNGDVVGYSLVSLCYKDKIFKQVHGIKWINGEAIDLHKKVPKADSSKASAINDHGDVLINGYLIGTGGQSIPISPSDAKATDANYLYNDMYVVNRNNHKITNGYVFSNKIYYDSNSIWMKFHKIISVNDNGEIIAQGETIYGEKHAMFLTPIKDD